MNGKSLATIFHEIREEVIRKLEESELLKEIKEIVYGERQRIGSLKSPAIWIIPDAYTPEIRGGHTIQHDIPFYFAVFVKSPNPEEGLKKAQELSFNVYDVLISDRTLGGIVNDVVPLRVDPAYEVGNSTQLYWSAVQFIFRLQRRE